METLRLAWGGVAAAALALTAACAEVDRTAVQAQAGAPVSAQVAEVSIPYNPSLPRFVIAVVPLDYGASGMTSGSGAPGAPSPNGSILAPLTGGLEGGGIHRTGGEPGSQVGIGMAAQLVTALTHCGNISVIQTDMLQRQADGSYACKLQPGEVGPFIMKGTVTEFNETADLSEKSRGGSLGGVGAVLGIAGAATGNQGLGWTGTGIAIANPTYENKSMQRQGMVGMDLQLTDGRSGRIVRGYHSSGTFKTQSAVSGMSVFGIGGGNAEFASSALGQATRAAMNDALRQTADALAMAPR